MRFSKDEEVIHELKPDSKLLFIWFFTRCMLHGLLVGVMPALYGWIYMTLMRKDIAAIESEWVLIGSVLFLVFVVGTVLSFVYHRYLLASITYFITDRRCVWKGGILKKTEHTVSYHKITDVERSQNLIEQILKISTINLFTPGTASMKMGAASQVTPELCFEGLTCSDEQAETINDQIRKHSSSQF